MAFKEGDIVIYLYDPKSIPVKGRVVSQEVARLHGLEKDWKNPEKVVALWEDNGRVQPVSISQAKLSGPRYKKNLPNWF